MADFVPFVPKVGLAASENMREFVRFCRESLNVFGADLDFDAPTWDLTDYYSERGRDRRLQLHFTHFSKRRGVLGPPMPEPFAAQAKAYIRYDAARRRRKRIPIQLVVALRALLAAFHAKGLTPDLSRVDAHILDHAVTLGTARLHLAYGATIGTGLCVLSKFLRERRLAEHAPIDWRHGYAYARPLMNKASAEKRMAMLPSPDALDALANAYRMSTEPRDVILTSAMALLCCAPSRVNEIFALSQTCELQPLTDGEDGYMLRWAGSKGHHDFAKGIPAVMADLAKEALGRLRKHTAEARVIAAWYEQNPGQLYLPDDCAHLRGKDLTAAEIAQIIGMSKSSSARGWVKGAGLRPVARMNVRKGLEAQVFRFAEVERAIVAYLPRGFPIRDKETGLKYSQALMIVRRNEFAAAHARPWRCMITAVQYAHLVRGFHIAPGKGHTEVFTRLGLSNTECPITLCTHQLRHHLNTLAQRGGLSEAQIAAWSGRKDVRQNRAYDHRSPEEKLEQKRRRDRELTAVRGGKTVKGNPPVTIAEVVERAIHGHATDIGFCEHDFASAVCPMFMDCLHCTKHVYVKRDPVHAERVAAALTLARQSLAKAHEAALRTYEGADDWVRTHTESVERLEQLYAILTNSEIPQGAVIRLGKSGQYSTIEQAMRDHQEIAGVQLLAPPDRRVLPGSKALADA